MIDMLNSIAKKNYEAAQQARSSSDDVSMTHVMTGGRARPVRPGSALALTNTAAQPAAGKRDGEVDPAAEPAAKKPIVAVGALSAIINVFGSRISTRTTIAMNI